MQAQSSRLGRERINATLGGQDFGKPQVIDHLRDGLLVSQGDDGIDAHGATGGNVAGEKCHSEKHSRHGCKCKRVAGAGGVEQAGHQTRQAKRGEYSNG